MIALLGGTFDPIHNGHLRLAINVKQALGCEAVHLLPSAQPPHRAQPERSAVQRLQMVTLAIQDSPDLCVNDCELRRDKPSYMVDTLRALRQDWGQQQPMSLILGSDAFAHLTTWHCWQQLFDLCHLIIVARPNEPPLSRLLNAELQACFAQRQTEDSANLHQQAAGLIHVQYFPDLEISATALRQALMQGDSVRHLLPDAVLAYIQAEQLYCYHRPTASPALQALIHDLKAAAKPEIAQQLRRFFKTGKGQYSEHDQFLGIYVPTQRALLAQHAALSLDDIAHLLYSRYHELRFSATLSLIAAYQHQRFSADEVFHFAWQHRRQFNNWDLVDAYAPKILGHYLCKRSKAPLYQLAYSGDLWQQRQAIVACLSLIQDQQSADCLRLVQIFMGSQEDLLQKACGWMLRELGKQQLPVLVDFLRKHAALMPRVMLRTALEKFSPTQRQLFLNKKDTRLL